MTRDFRVLAASCTLILGLVAVEARTHQVPASAAVGAAGQSAPTAPRSGGRGGQADPQTIALWDGAAPSALGEEDSDKPVMTLYPAGGRARTAVVIAPGGA